MSYIVIVNGNRVEFYDNQEDAAGRVRDLERNGDRGELMDSETYDALMEEQYNN